MFAPHIEWLHLPHVWVLEEGAKVEAAKLVPDGEGYYISVFIRYGNWLKF